MTPPQPSANTNKNAEGTSRAHNLLTAAATAFTTSLAQTRNEALTLTSTWTGTAATDFRAAMHDWESHLTTVIAELNHMADALQADKS